MRLWPDVALAIVLAILFAVVADLLRVGSRIREFGRWIKDKQSASSIMAITQRIAQQEQYRNRLRAYLASDKTLYLDLLRSIVAVLLSMCIAGIVIIFGGLKVMELPLAELLALGAMASAIAAGIAGMQFGSFDDSKLSELIGKIDAEILALEEARRKLQKPHNIVK